MAGGIPVIAFDVDHLPNLVAGGGQLVPYPDGYPALRRACRQVLRDPVGYERIARAGYYRSRDYRPAHVADLLLKVVS